MLGSIREYPLRYSESQCIRYFLSRLHGQCNPILEYLVGLKVRAAASCAHGMPEASICETIVPTCVDCDFKRHACSTVARCNTQRKMQHTTYVKIEMIATANRRWAGAQEYRQL